MRIANLARSRRVFQGFTLTQHMQRLYAAKGLKGEMWAPDVVMSSLWQDTAGTATPVTAASQPVGRMYGLSGNGLYVRQVTSTARPVYNGAGLTYDGIDDFLSSAAAHNMAGSTYVYMAFAGVKSSATPNGSRIWSSTGSFTSTPGSVGMMCNNSANTIDLYARTSTATLYRPTVANNARFSAFGALNLNVTSPTAQLQAWINGSAVSTAGGSACATGAMTSGNPFYLGGASGFFNGSVGRLAVMGATSPLSYGEMDLLLDWAEEGRTL